jgi:hypothetical protein
MSLPQVQQTIAELREVRDDVAMRRVWTSVAFPEVDGLARLSARSWRKERSATRRVAWFVGGAMTAAVAATALWIGVPAGKKLVATAVLPSRSLREVATTTVENREKERTSLLRGGAPVHAGETALPVSLPGGAAATLAPGTTVKVDEDGRLVLLEGGSRFDVPLQTQTLVVQAGAYRVVVAGTRFRVDIAPSNQAIRVAVESGTAEIFAADAPDAPLAHLSPGSRWASDARPPEAGASTIPEAAAGEKTSERDPVQIAFGSARRHHRTSSRMAENLEGRSSTEGLAAENAAYERGKNLRDVQHRSDAALMIWRECRQQHPSGALRPEVDLSIFETLVRTHDVTAAIGEGAGFLRRYPDSERRSEVARLVGDLHRTRGDCRRAIDAYDLALAARPRGDMEDHLAFERASCLMQSGGSGSDDGDALQKYLESHPAGRYRKAATSLLATAGSRAP